jgi:arylsulfatase A-like enzyme
MHGAPRPNIVLLLADDLGYRDLGCYGVADIRTPVIDWLAARGVRFTQFYASTQCTPTRAALLTGRYEQRIGGLECAIGVGNVGRYDDAIRLRETNDLGLPADEPTLARLLKKAGYATAITGKWHLGYEDKFSPNAHGFDYAFYFLGGEMDYFHYTERETPDDSMIRLNGKPVKRDGYFTDLMTDEAEKFIVKNRERPFFLYVPFLTPHAPFQGPDDRLPEPLPADSPLWSQGRAPRAVYTAMVESLDQAVGRILDTLEHHGLTDRTLVIFMSDNGGTGSARPTGLRGNKGTTFEGGIRVPCIARWPGVLPEGMTTTQVGITMDLTASILRAAGAKPPAGPSLDGIDILARIAEGRPENSRTLFWRVRRGQTVRWAARDGDLKYVSVNSDGNFEEWLFDLSRDPGEQNDLRSQQAADLKRLKGLLAEWENEVRPGR